MLSVGLKPRIAILTRILHGGSLRDRFIRGAGGTFVLQLASLALTFSVSVVLARLLGADGYGMYSYAMALVSLLSIPAKLGFPQLLVRNIPAYYTREAWGELRGLLRRADQLVLLSSAGIILSVLFTTWGLNDKAAQSEVTMVLWISLLLIPVIGLIALRESALRGLLYVISGQIPRMLIRPILFLVLLGAMYLGQGPHLTTLRAMLLQVIASLAALFLGAIWLSRHLPEPVKHAPAVYHTWKWIREAFPFLFIVGTHVVNSQADIIMLGLLSNTTAVGIYKVANQGALFVTFPLVAISMVLGPTVSSVYASGQMKRLQRVVTISARAMFVSSFPIAMAMVFFGRWFLLLVFGHEFTQGAAVLAILSIGLLMNALGGAAGLILEMSAYAKDTARWMGLAAAVNVLLNRLLIPRWGVEGVAVATAISLILQNSLLVIWVQRRLGIHTTVLDVAWIRR